MHTVQASKMRWTKEPPTEPGWYWFRNKIGSTGIVEVDRALLDLAQDHYKSFLKGEFDYCLCWAGPIDEPLDEVSK